MTTPTLSPEGLIERIDAELERITGSHPFKSIATEARAVLLRDMREALSRSAIGDEAVERVARALYEASGSMAAQRGPWESAPDHVEIHFRKLARVALTAAVEAGVARDRQAAKQRGCSTCGGAGFLEGQGSPEQRTNCPECNP